MKAKVVRMIELPPAPPIEVSTKSMPQLSLGGVPFRGDQADELRKHGAKNMFQSSYWASALGARNLLGVTLKGETQEPFLLSSFEKGPGRLVYNADQFVHGSRFNEFNCCNYMPATLRGRNFPHKQREYLHRRAVKTEILMMTGDIWLFPGECSRYGYPRIIKDYCGYQKEITRLFGITDFSALHYKLRPEDIISVRSLLSCNLVTADQVRATRFPILCNR